MKLNITKAKAIKFALIALLLVTAPFVVPFALEFIVLADFVGLEALIILALAYGKALVNEIRQRSQIGLTNIAQTMVLLSEIYMFRPKVFIGHAAASSIFVVFACSVFMACVVWMPVMLASANMLSG